MGKLKKITRSLKTMDIDFNALDRISGIQSDETTVYNFSGGVFKSVTHHGIEIFKN